MSLGKIFDALACSIQGVLMVVGAMAVIGIVFGSVIFTDLSINLSL